MKQFIGYIGLSLGLLLGAISCKKDEVDASRTVISPTSKVQTPFDTWLKKNFLDAYNIDVIYRMLDNETPRDKPLTPASVENSMKMSKLIKHTWLNAYDEVGGINFSRKYVPKQILYVGSTSGGLLGTAEQGAKVVLYQVDFIEQFRQGSKERLIDVYFHTMHHEFAHILHQTVQWPQEFKEITPSDYLPGSWQIQTSMGDYAPKGFVSAYSRSKDSEDIAEVTASLICWNQSQWDALYKAAGAEGTALINRKVELVKNYMKEHFNVDILQLRDAVSRRIDESMQLDLLEDEWREQISNTFRSTLSELRSTAGLRRNQATAVKPRGAEFEREDAHRNCSYHLHQAAVERWSPSVSEDLSSTIKTED